MSQDESDTAGALDWDALLARFVAMSDQADLPRADVIKLRFLLERGPHFTPRSRRMWTRGNNLIKEFHHLEKLLAYNELLQELQDQAASQASDSDSPKDAASDRNTAEPGREHDEAELRDHLVEKGVKIQVRLVEFMQGKHDAPSDEVGRSVHYDEDLTTDKAIEANCRRVREAAKRLGLSIRYWLRGGRVVVTMDEP
jgi:hypothetical protein